MSMPLGPEYVHQRSPALTQRGSVNGTWYQRGRSGLSAHGATTPRITPGNAMIDRCGNLCATGYYTVAGVPRMTVLCADNTPPLPCTIAVSQPATWR